MSRKPEILGFLGFLHRMVQKNPNKLLANSIFYHSFPDSSIGKESACNAGDPGSIPGLGTSTGKEIGYPLQYSWASLTAQLVKNLPAMWVWSLGWEDPLEKGKSTHYCILAWRIPWTEDWQAIVHRVAKESTGLQRVGHNWATFTCIYFMNTNKCMYIGMDFQKYFTDKCVWSKWLGTRSLEGYRMELQNI